MSVLKFYWKKATWDLGTLFTKNKIAGRFRFPRILTIRGISFPIDERDKYLNIPKTSIDLTLWLNFETTFNWPPCSYLRDSAVFLDCLDSSIKISTLLFLANHKVAVYKNTRGFSHGTYNPRSGFEGLDSEKYREKFDSEDLTFKHWCVLNKDFPTKEFLRSLNFPPTEKLKRTDFQGIRPVFGLSLKDLKLLRWRENDYRAQVSDYRGKNKSLEKLKLRYIHPDIIEPIQTS